MERERKGEERGCPMGSTVIFVSVTGIDSHHKSFFSLLKDFVKMKLYNFLRDPNNQIASQLGMVVSSCNQEIGA